MEATLDEILEGIESVDIGKELLRQGKSIVYNDKNISDRYSILENALGEKFLVDLDEAKENLVIIRQL
ncbi:MAG: hypothetical protein LBQ18_07670 [Campylobacteraceae bacterium]|jgi:hypothetical protein|nr:hypothetical protein [Campylobacteraceae bacterium]